MIKAKGPTARLMANELRLADHFPRNPKACRAVADTFFACFSEKSVQPPGGDKEAGRRGLAQCKKEMEAYDACMLKFLKKNQPEFFRVQDEYRRSTVLSDKVATGQ